MLVPLLVIFIASLLSPLISRIFKNGTGYILGLFLIPMFIYFLTFYEDIVKHGHIKSQAWNFIPGIQFIFYLDGLSLVFSILVIGIGLLVLIYSSSYLKNKPHQGRYYGYLLFFMASMVGIVLSGNIIALYIFWSLTGLSSFLLIGFYNADKESRNAALQALLVTEAGGLAMLAGLILLGIIGDNSNITELFIHQESIRTHSLYPAIVLLILGGAFTKSAQFPFHFWLPSAMKAPTPVSAFLHSATMVNAGIYLVARLNPLFGNNMLWKYLLMGFGLFSFFAGVYLSLTKKDLKIILAYTTISSLGLMLFLFGAGSTNAVKAALLYLVAHALFKAALFMVTGIIDIKTGTRNIDHLGNLKKNMPVTTIIALLALLSMAGLPPLLGFVGKEFFYEATMHNKSTGPLILAAGLFSNSMMFFISAIIAYKVFFQSKPHKSNPSEAKIGFLIAPAILSILGFILAVIPGKFENLLAFSTEAVKCTPVEVNIQLWKGFDNVFLLSLITIGIGFLLFFWRKKIYPLLERLNRRLLQPEFSIIPRNIYQEFARLNTNFTKSLQPSYLGVYLLIVIVFTSILMWVLLLGSEKIIGPDVSQVSNGVTVIALVAAAIAVATTIIERKLAAIVTMGVTGYGVAMIYMLYGAVDLSITQMLVETFILVLFVMVVYRLPQFEKYSGKAKRLRDALVAIVAGGAISTVLVLTTTRTKISSEVSDEIIRRSLEEAHGRNIVNVILVDFRGLDTLGEITVITLAALGIMMMLKNKITKLKE